MRKATVNWTQQAWVLKCDVRRFFDSIDHDVLLGLIRKEVVDARVMALVECIVRGFKKGPGRGLPLGNVTSQLFANVYMNELDQFIKHGLKVRLYARYCDDFVVVHQEREELLVCIPKIRRFLFETLLIDLHPCKVSVRKARQGVDFLGYVVLPHRKVLRTKTKRRMMKKLSRAPVESIKRSAESYKGALFHCKGERLKNAIDALCAKMLQPSR